MHISVKNRIKSQHNTLLTEDEFVSDNPFENVTWFLAMGRVCVCICVYIKCRCCNNSTISRSKQQLQTTPKNNVFIQMKKRKYASTHTYCFLHIKREVSITDKASTAKQATSQQSLDLHEKYQDRLGPTKTDNNTHTHTRKIPSRASPTYRPLI